MELVKNILVVVIAGIILLFLFSLGVSIILVTVGLALIARLVVPLFLHKHPQAEDNSPPVIEGEYTIVDDSSSTDKK